MEQNRKRTEISKQSFGNMRDQSNIRLQDSPSKYKYKPERPTHGYRARGRLLRDFCSLNANKKSKCYNYDVINF